jgi:hypothetical protein
MSSVMNSERMPNIATINVGTQAASITLPGLYFRKRSRIKEVKYIDQAGLAADNTNFLQLSLQDASSVVYAALDTRAANQGALTANVAKVMPLTTDVGDTVGSQPEADVAAATTLKLVVTKNGTGVPTLGVLQIEWYPL